MNPVQENQSFREILSGQHIITNTYARFSGGNALTDRYLHAELYRKNPNGIDIGEGVILPTKILPKMGDLLASMIGHLPSACSDERVFKFVQPDQGQMSFQHDQCGLMDLVSSSTGGLFTNRTLAKKYGEMNPMIYKNEIQPNDAHEHSHVAKGLLVFAPGVGLDSDYSAEMYHKGNGLYFAVNAPNEKQMIDFFGKNPKEEEVNEVVGALALWGPVLLTSIFGGSHNSSNFKNGIYRVGAPKPPTSTWVSTEREHTVDQRAMHVFKNSMIQYGSRFLKDHNFGNAFYL